MLNVVNGVLAKAGDTFPLARMDTLQRPRWACGQHRFWRHTGMRVHGPKDSAASTQLWSHIQQHLEPGENGSVL